MKSTRNAWWKVATTFLVLLGMTGAGVPAHARFVGADPVKPDTNTGENFNRYSYANNSPYRYTDPDGRLPILIPVAIGAGIGLLTQSGSAQAPAPGEATSAMSLGDAAVTYLEVLPFGRAGAVGRAITFGVAPIQGNPQATRSGGQETMHGPTSQREATRQSNESTAVSVHMNQTLKTVTNGQVDSSLRGDIATVRTNGTVDITEVLSPRQDAASTIKKYQDALGDRAGTITCIQPDKC